MKKCAPTSVSCRSTPTSPSTISRLPRSSIPSSRAASVSWGTCAEAPPSKPTGRRNCRTTWMCLQHRRHRARARERPRPDAPRLRHLCRGPEVGEGERPALLSPLLEWPSRRVGPTLQRRLVQRNPHEVQISVQHDAPAARPDSRLLRPHGVVRFLLPALHQPDPGRHRGGRRDNLFPTTRTKACSC